MKLVGPGWLLEPDMSALVEKMLWVVAHPNDARERGRLASEFARREFTWEKAAAIITERIKELAASAASKTSPAKPAVRKAPPIVLPACAKIAHLGGSRELLRQKIADENGGPKLAAKQDKKISDWQDLENRATPPSSSTRTVVVQAAPPPAAANKDQSAVLNKTEDQRLYSFRAEGQDLKLALSSFAQANGSTNQSKVTMGKQYNKVLKRKRRNAYNKRKKTAAKTKKTKKATPA